MWCVRCAEKLLKAFFYDMRYSLFYQIIKYGNKPHKHTIEMNPFSSYHLVYPITLTAQYGNELYLRERPGNRVQVRIVGTK